MTDSPLCRSGCAGRPTSSPHQRSATQPTWCPAITLPVPLLQDKNAIRVKSCGRGRTICRSPEPMTTPSCRGWTKLAKSSVTHSSPIRGARTEGVAVSHHYVAKLWPTKNCAPSNMGPTRPAGIRSSPRRSPTSSWLYLDPPGGGVVLVIDKSTQTGGASGFFRDPLTVPDRDRRFHFRSAPARFSASFGGIPQSMPGG